MPTLTEPKAEVADLLSEVMRKYHGPLADAGVTVGLLAQWPSENADPGEPCLKLNGYPCAAVVKITPYRQRVQGIADAVITLDAVGWKDLAHAEQEALLDHELTHLELARDGDGNVKADDAGRPKLKMRLHDVQAGWFLDVARRHGPASFEVKQAREIRTHQELFTWADDMAGEPTGEPAPGLPDGVTFVGSDFPKIAATGQGLRESAS